MRRDAWISVVSAAFGVLVIGFMTSEVEAFREVGAWWFIAAGALNGSLHAPNALTLLVVAFIPLFIVVFAARRLWSARMNRSQR
jgi:hypothetical protein